MLKRIWNFVKNILTYDPDQEYLNQAKDIHDLERRLQELQSGRRPFLNNPNFWI